MPKPMGVAAVKLFNSGMSGAVASVQTVGARVTGAVEDLAESVTDAAGGVMTALASAAGGVAGAAQGLGESVTGSAEQVSTALSSAASGLGQSVAMGASSVATAVDHATQAVNDARKEGIKVIHIIDPATRWTLLTLAGIALVGIVIAVKRP